MNYDMENPVIPFDAAVESQTCLLFLIYPKNKTQNYALAVSVSKGAHRYGETSIDGKLIHCVAFADTDEDISRCVITMNYLHGVKGAQYFAKGRILLRGVLAVKDVIRCYEVARGCNDYRAHCHITASDGIIKFNSYVFPCRRLKQHHCFSFQRGHPSAYQDLIQAAAREHHLEICPYFNESDFKIMF